MTKEVVVVQAITENGQITEAEQFIVEEFKIYKKVSMSLGHVNFATPNENTTQLTEESVHQLFGRDRIFDFPDDLITEIWSQHLTHVHIDSDGIWDETPVVQWHATSKNALIYSAFPTETEYVFVVHEILKDFEANDEKGAHKFYTKDDITIWLELAEWERDRYPSAEQVII
ncbi:type II toxin-antitoxin system YafO family toxin [Shewanella basaltis]|uniref:type II toxin-antitoxin system YafO family toxin n=1 Tax=Shewanella basaltis TaxID=472183 RepID=UPI003AB00BFE